MKIGNVDLGPEAFSYYDVKTHDWKCPLSSIEKNKLDICYSFQVPGGKIDITAAPDNRNLTFHTPAIEHHGLDLGPFRQENMRMDFFCG